LLQALPLWLTLLKEKVSCVVKLLPAELSPAGIQNKFNKFSLDTEHASSTFALAAAVVDVSLGESVITSTL
jgi:hypothetical protein